MNRYKSLYYELLPNVITLTTSIGFFTGINSMFVKQQNPQFFTPMINMLGCTTIGAIIGYTYPISLPACSLFIILNPPKKEN